MPARLLALLVCFVAAPAFAESAKVDVAGAAIELVVPNGHCRLKREEAADGEVLANLDRVVAGANRVLMAFAECGQLDAVRSGRALLLKDFGAYLTPLRGGVQTMAPAQFAQQMTEVFTKQGAQILKMAEEHTREKINSLNMGLKVGEHRLVGVLRTDQRASYIGIVQNIGLPDGTSAVQLALVSAGLLRQRVVSLNLYAPFGGGERGDAVITRVLNMSAEVYTATAAANGQ